MEHLFVGLWRHLTHCMGLGHGCWCAAPNWVDLRRHSSVWMCPGGTALKSAQESSCGGADTDVLNGGSEVRMFLVRVLLADPCLLPVSTLGRGLFHHCLLPGCGQEELLHSR